MKYNREYEIAWQGLKLGIHTFVFEIGDEFMKGREVDKDIHDWNAKVTLEFDKHENFFILHFNIGGQVTVPCDRCGDEFSLNLWDEFKLIIKVLGENSEQIEDENDVVFIPRGETVIDLSNWMFEFVMLSIPLQHIHPDLPDGSLGCNREALKLLNMLAKQSEDENENSEEPNDVILN